MTPEDRARYQALCDALPRGEWKLIESVEAIDGEAWPSARIIVPLSGTRAWIDLVPYSTHVDEMRFLVAARTALPEALADNAALEERLATAERERDEWKRLWLEVVNDRDRMVVWQDHAEQAERERDEARGAIRNFRLADCRQWVGGCAEDCHLYPYCSQEVV